MQTEGQKFETISATKQFSYSVFIQELFEHQANIKIWHKEYPECISSQIKPNKISEHISNNQPTISESKRNVLHQELVGFFFLDHPTKLLIFDIF